MLKLKITLMIFDLIIEFTYCVLSCVMLFQLTNLLLHVSFTGINLKCKCEILRKESKYIILRKLLYSTGTTSLGKTFYKYLL